LPPDLDPLLGVFAAHMGPICANGLLHAAAEAAGEDTDSLADGVRDRIVVVVGAGVVGLLVALFAAQHGAAAVAVVDETPERLAAAAGLGLTALDARAAPWREVKTRWRHGPRDRGADVVFQCRGNDAALAEALRCCRPQASVIDLAFYPDGAPHVRLGEEFHHNGLAIRCAQIGRVPRGLADRWDRERLSAETLRLLRARGDDVRRVLVSDIVGAAHGPELLLAMAERRRHVIQAVLDYGVSGAR
jgi:threonine dehydrogenase-like Zn-dependent dehydrogenase